MENCYILYSCDGSQEPVISNDQQLSGYVNNFVAVTLLDPEAVIKKCYFVFDLGEIDCPVVYTIEIDPDVECNCPNLCYFVKYGTVEQTTTYVDNNNQLTLRNFSIGETYNFCSKIYPVFEVTGSTQVTVKSACVGNNCPPSLSTVKNQNECDVLTIFPMSVECITLNPTSDVTFDGSTQLYITGGTPPYTIEWEFGSFAPALNNLGPGVYNATISDYYGDFVIDTSCVLTAITTTFSGMCFVLDGGKDAEDIYFDVEFSGIKNTKPYYTISTPIQSYGVVFWDEAQGIWVFCLDFNCGTNSYYNYLDNNDGDYPSTYGTYYWSAGTNNSQEILDSYVGPCEPPTPIVTYPNLCAFYLIRSNDPDMPFTQIFVDLAYNGMVNGQPSWQSSDTLYDLYWNSGSTPNQWVMTGYAGTPTSLVASNNPSVPPLSNWLVYGDATIDTFSVFSGACNVAETVGFDVQTNNAECDQGGSIMIDAYGGTPPYLYSINGGQTFSASPYFPNLSPGTYLVQVSDLNGVSSQTSVQITSTTNIIYQLGFGFSIATNTFTVVAPPLPPGVTISFQVVHTNVFNYSPNSLQLSPTPPSYNNIATIIGIGPLALYQTISSFSNIGGPCTSVFTPLIQNQFNSAYFANVTLSSSQTINGTVTNTIVNPPTGDCETASGSYNIQIINIQMNNCYCCSAQLVGI